MGIGGDAIIPELKFLASHSAKIQKLELNLLYQN